MNTLKAPQTQNQVDFLERSRDTILSLGYDYVVFKSKVKKALLIIKRRIVR
ncbi:hypothetical protein MTsPCn9_05760 [Croceitalea sp. MTPC9]|uniref:hypothetical protein n=1 Tax=unclassified Croceitalea TaxID=2632280 RepID=UPI002B39C1C9|nr:hypothetical protein MTsPCn6_02950 [Croceitalea sp. MTPC6]GMN15640.1 hypothetical protein MTsPCn9_05760 [Croceitalea sp. MTPC9]